jgi:arylsulfatase
LPYGGVINLNAAESKPWWPPRVAPPKGAPNILLIMTDDVGFGAPSTFGGVIPTPALDRIAKQGLRYTQFHSTALCSPTRAALITGRNHHSAGFGVVSEQSTGYPGYDSLISKDVATIGEILKQHGYATSWFGKNHNTPTFVASQAGPFDQWPVGMGFEYFFGFIGGDTSQWQPNLFRNTTAIYPYLGNPNWNLTTAMADDAIYHIHMLDEIAPEKPFFVYYVPGGTHSPHHPTPEWIAKFKGKFDKGWNVLREEIFANQKRLGVIPQEAKLTPWPDDLLKQWDALTADEKKLFAHQAEVYAAYLAYTDHEIGRVIQTVEDIGKLDNTLIIYISGDNGASAEGTLVGTPNEVAMFNGINVPVEVQLKDFYEVWGSDKTYPHMAVAWSWAFDTPYKWTKQIASHFGGTRQGMAISWPKRIKDKGGIRNQFHHVIDIVPTLLEATGIQAPDRVNGVPQKPIEGVSMAYTFDKKNAHVPSTHKTQYFEMMGDRALYHEGWVIATTPIRPPWDVTGPTTQDPANAYKWELYNVAKDWTQFTDLSSLNPEKVKELQELLWIEMAKYQVLPLDASVASRLIAPRPNLTAGKTEFIYTYPITGIPLGDAPSLLNTSYSIAAEIEIPKEGAEGMLATQGGRFGGWGFYVLKNKPVFLWNLVDLERLRWEGAQPLTAGKHNVEFTFKYDGAGAGTLAFNSFSGIGQGGFGELKVDGKVVASQKMKHTLPLILQWDETFDIGSDTGTSVNDKDYQVPFTFTGKLTKLTLKLDPPKLSEAEEKLLKQEGQRNNKASE